ncbi:MAG: hypothetical protein ACI4QO_08105 [Clostridia bacterium]
MSLLNRNSKAPEYGNSGAFFCISAVYLSSCIRETPLYRRKSLGSFLRKFYPQPGFPGTVFYAGTSLLVPISMISALVAALIATAMVTAAAVAAASAAPIAAPERPEEKREHKSTSLSWGYTIIYVCLTGLVRTYFFYFTVE